MSRVWVEPIDGSAFDGAAAISKRGDVRLHLARPPKAAERAAALTVKAAQQAREGMSSWTATINVSGLVWQKQDLLTMRLK